MGSGVGAFQQRLVPPFCPNPDCDSHGDPGTWRFRKKGFFFRQARPRRIQRYVCSQCGRNFSSQTFSTTYWLRHPELLVPVFHRSLGCSAFRQIAREFGRAHTTVMRLAERMGRHCLLFHERFRPRVPLETLVLDGLRAFEFGQYWPFDLNVLIGASHFIYGFNDAELRRSGTMRPAQRRRRAALEAACGRPNPRATEGAVRELVARVIPRGASVHLYTDKHRAYPLALGKLGDRDITHHTTSSKASRTPRNPLFPANLADLLIRHTGANHKRETIAFSKRRQGALYRVAIFVVWRNYIKSTSEKRRDPPPGVQLGLIPKALGVEEVLGGRLFPWQSELEGWLEQSYFGRIPTRRFARCRSHQLKYAI